MVQEALDLVMIKQWVNMIRIQLLREDLMLDVIHQVNILLLYLRKRIRNVLENYTYKQMIDIHEYV